MRLLQPDLNAQLNEPYLLEKIIDHQLFSNLKQTNSVTNLLES